MFQSAINEFLYKIIKEYSESLGLNFPPCVNQELNAIAKYVITHELTVDKLLELLQGSETIVVDESEDGKHVEIHLDADVVAILGRALLMPLNAPAKDSAVVVNTSGEEELKPLDEIGGKLYLHRFQTGSDDWGDIFISVVSSSSTPFTFATFCEKYNGVALCARYSGEKGTCSVGIAITHGQSSNTIALDGLGSAGVTISEVITDGTLSAYNVIEI